MASQRINRRLLLALGGLPLLCAAVLLLAFALQPPRFTSRADAIGYVLQQRGIIFEHVYVNRAWPDTVNSITYGANLIIVLSGVEEVPGRIECRSGEQNCYINVVRLGIDRAPIPDLSKPREAPLLTWLEHRYDAIRAGRLP